MSAQTSIQRYFKPFQEQLGSTDVDLEQFVSDATQEKIEAQLALCLNDPDEKCTSSCQELKGLRPYLNIEIHKREVVRELELNTGVCFQKFQPFSGQSLFIGFASDSILSLNFARITVSKDLKMNFGTHILRRIEAAGMAVLMLANMVARVALTIFAGLAAIFTLFKNQAVCDFLSNSMHQSFLSVPYIGMALVGIFSPKRESTILNKFMNTLIQDRTTKETITEDQRKQTASMASDV